MQFKGLSLTFTCLFLMTVLISFGQGYRTGLGPVWGGRTNNGFSVKHFIGSLTEKNNNAVEVLVVTLYKGILITTLYERHNPIYFSDKLKGFNWYYGAGLHTGTFLYNPNTCKDKGNYDRIISFGADLVLGLEYEIQNAFPHLRVPLSAGFDLKPYYDLIGGQCSKNYFFYSLSLKYVFGH